MWKTAWMWEWRREGRNVSGKCRVAVLALQMSSQTSSSYFLLNQMWLKWPPGKNLNQNFYFIKCNGKNHRTVWESFLQQLGSRIFRLLNAIISITSDDFTGVAQSSRESAITEGSKRWSWSVAHSITLRWWRWKRNVEPITGGGDLKRSEENLQTWLTYGIWHIFHVQKVLQTR